MRMRTISAISPMGAIFLVMICASVSTALAQGGHDVTVQVHSKWVGLGAAKESTFSLVQRGGRCYVDGKAVESQLLENLLRELAVPSDTASLADLGITQSWLDQNAAPAYADHARDQPKVDRNRFLASYQDVGLVGQLLPELLRGGWTDDYPLIELAVHRADGSTVTLASKRQNVFMVPFEITENGAKRDSFNVGLARALVALMPAKFTNRERLSGDNLRSLVADKVIVKMRNS